MGTLTRTKAWLSSQLKQRSFQNPLAGINLFADVLHGLVAGLTTGTTVLISTPPDPDVYAPTVSGERIGEIYVSNDRTPALVWIWTNTGWSGLSGASSGSSPAPGGLDTEVQFNDGGALVGDSGLTYNKTTNALTAGSLITNTISTASTLTATATYIYLTNTAADNASGTQVGTTINTPAYTTYGTKLLAIKNNSIEKAYVDTDGRYVNPTGFWDDVQGPVGQAGGAPALTFEAYRDTAYLGYFFRHNQNDVLYLTYQMPHSWDRGTVYPHIHIIPMVNPAAAQVIRFSGKYAWSQAGVATPADISWTPFTADHTVNTTDEFIHVIVPLATVSPATNPRESNTLLMWVQRESSSPSDTYTTNKVLGTGAANVMVATIDAHFAKSKPGTVNPTPGTNP